MSDSRELVLVGGGHAHIQVLKALAMRPEPDVRLTLVVDRHLAVYSGMVPGCVAGQYRVDEVQIDLRPLARRAGARVILAEALGVDAPARRLQLSGRPRLAYDLLSFDIGSSVRGLQLPGVLEHAVPTRPIGRFLRRLDEALERVPEGARAVVVGAGAAGAELAFALRARGIAQVQLIEAGPDPLPGMAPAVQARLRVVAAERGVELITAARVARVEAQAVLLDDGRSLPTDLVLWAVGAQAPPLFASSGVAHQEGYARVRETLQLLEHDELFAVGDCAHFDPQPLAKAGVYAVRQGPVLERNLRAVLRGERLRAYRPQKGFLALLNLGDGSALGTKWGRVAVGPRVFRLKDRIDRRFMARFQVLDPSGTPTRDFPPMPGMDEMVCGGCAAKLSAGELARALARLPAQSDPDVVVGIAEREDVSVTRFAGGQLAASVDGFSAFVDDPFTVGRVGAVNAASDLIAKGVAPRFAQAWVSVPDDAGDRVELLEQLLAGARRGLADDGVTLVGGHTTLGELSIGFAIWGEVDPERPLLRMAALRPGDALVLTKPLGTGVLFHADMAARAAGPWIDAALASMTRSNGPALAALRAAEVLAATDVTGFGLARHLGEMLEASGCSARVRASALPALPGSCALIASGERSTFHAQNAELARSLRVAPELAEDPRAQLLFDPQTSGGLLLGVAPDRLAGLLEALRAGAAPEAVAIGEVVERDPDGALFELSA